MSELLNSGRVGHNFKLTEEQLKKHNKEAQEEWDRLEKTFTRKVLFEKYEPYRKLGILEGWRQNRVFIK
jgi:hypothetical protein